MNNGRDVTEPDIIIPIATTAGGAGVVFSREERERHVYIVGKSGSGKSTFLFNLAMGDILAGEGVAVIDPHGDLALDILDAIPRSRINDVCYLDVIDSERPVGFNPATRVAPERRALAGAGIVSAFKHLWSDSWGPRLEHFLFHGVADLYATIIHATTGDFQQVNAQTICVGNTPSDPNPICVTKTQLAALLSQTASAQPPESVSSSAPQNPSSNFPISVSSATSSQSKSATSTAVNNATSPQIQINGNNPATIQIGDSYNDLRATITGPTADLNLGIQTCLNGTKMTPVLIDTSEAPTDTIDYVATDQSGLTATSARTVLIEASPSIIPINSAGQGSGTTITTTDATSTAQ